MAKPVVAIVGRPNVGKSTLFNKLIGERRAIVEDTPGVTRDRIYGDVTYDEKTFLLIDTGGIDLGVGDFNKDIKAQAEIAVEESDVIVFVVDGREDLTSNDLYIRDMLMKTNKKEQEPCLLFFIYSIFFIQTWSAFCSYSGSPQTSNPFFS